MIAIAAIGTTTPMATVAPRSNPPPPLSWASIGCGSDVFVLELTGGASSTRVDVITMKLVWSLLVMTCVMVVSIVVGPAAVVEGPWLGRGDELDDVGGVFCDDEVSGIDSCCEVEEDVSSGTVGVGVEVGVVGAG